MSMVASATRTMAGLRTQLRRQDLADRHRKRHGALIRGHHQRPDHVLDSVIRGPLSYESFNSTSMIVEKTIPTIIMQPRS